MSPLRNARSWSWGYVASHATRSSWPRARTEIADASGSVPKKSNSSVQNSGSEASPGVFMLMYPSGLMQRSHRSPFCSAVSNVPCESFHFAGNSPRSSCVKSSAKITLSPGTKSNFVDTVETLSPAPLDWAVGFAACVSPSPLSFFAVGSAAFVALSVASFVFFVVASLIFFFSASVKPAYAVDVDIASAQHRHSTRTRERFMAHLSRFMGLGQHGDATHT